MTNKILLPVVLESYRPLKDKSFSLSFSTNILTPEQILILNNMHQQMCFVLIKDSEIDNAEQDLMDKTDADSLEGTRTLSQRQRAVLYINWQQKSEGFADFKDYYRQKMEKNIQHFKNQLD